MGHQIDDQEQHGQNRTDGHAENSTGCAIFKALAHLQQVPCQRQTNAQLAQGFQHLRNGRGGHVALTLGIAAHTGQQADAEHSGSQCLHRRCSQTVLQEGRQKACPEEHEQRTHQTQTKEQPDGGAEDLPLLVLFSLCMGLTGHLGDGQRKTCRGNGQQNVIDVICRVEIGFSLSAQNVVQGQLIECTDDLDYGNRCRQNGGTSQKGLFLG